MIIVPPDTLEVKREKYITSLEPAMTVKDLITRSSNCMHTFCQVAWVLNFLYWIKWHVEKEKNPKTADLHRGINHEEKSKRKIAIVVHKSNLPNEVRILKEGNQ